MKLPNLILTSLCLIIGTTFYAQTTRYVKQIATGNGNGSSWANASDDLQAMINASSSGNQDVILVAAGTYKPNRRADAVTVITPNDRDNAFVLKTHVEIHGGYPANTNGSGGQDPDLNPTILSGDIGVLNDSTDNCYHVVMGGGSFQNTSLDGFIIRDGNANATTQITVNGEVVPRSQGGGVYCINNSSTSTTGGSFSIQNCKFINNAALKGGAISSGGFFNTHCSIEDCNFINNAATTSGGGIYNGGYSTSVIVIERCKFNNNTALNGGALSNGDNSTLGYFNIQNSSFINNTGVNGGGVYQGAANLSVSKITNCNFISNTAISGNCVYNTNNVAPSSLDLLNCIIWNNNNSINNLANIGGSMSVTYSIVEGGYTGTGNSVLDPLFTDAPNGDFSLQVSSPAINMGDFILPGSIDLAGNPRIVGPGIDVGAYESPYGVITPNSEGIVFVNKTVAGGNGNGNNWENANTELAEALKAAKTNTAITQIWVAKGTYSPMYNPSTNFTDYEVRDNTFLLVNNVKIFGGFQNANETNINQRDTINLNTVLSGERPGDNYYHVVLSAGPVGTACLNGFTIRDGFASGSSISNPGISVNSQSISKDNGGGIYLNTSSPAIHNCAIINNRAADYGGGIFNVTESSNPILNCRISNNTASYGAGIYNGLSYPLIENCIISSNEAWYDGGGIYATGIMSVIQTDSVRIKNSLITSNTSVKGGGIYVKNRTAVLLTNSTLADNTGNGSIYAENNTYCHVAFHNTLLWDNSTGFVSGSGSNTYTSFYSLVQDKNDFPANGNLDGTNPGSDPLFVDTASNNFTLQPCSPAINAGSNAEYTLMNGNLVIDKDLAGNPRLFDGTIDMGAYELQTSPVSQIVPVFTQVTPICSGASLSLPDSSTNGISGTWAPAPNNTQTTTYTFTPNPGQCAATSILTMTVTVNPLDNPSFSYPVTSVCTGNLTITPSSILAPGGTFSSITGLSINVVTGEIDVASSQVGTYTITYTTAQACPMSSTKVITIKDLTNAAFSYAQSSYCTSVVNAVPVPVVPGSIGSLSAVPSGLVINPSTGQIFPSISSPGLYQVTNTIAASGNCPSDAETITLSIEANPAAVISLSGETLSVNPVNGATYQWIKCSSEDPVPGEVGTSFTPAVGGPYAVIVTTGNCSTTSTCKTVTFLGLEDHSQETVKVYPNPTNGLVYISSIDPVSVTVIGMDSKIVLSKKNAEMIDLTDAAAGVYSVKITDKDGILLKTERIVVNK